MIAHELIYIAAPTATIYVCTYIHTYTYEPIGGATAFPFILSLAHWKAHFFRFFLFVRYTWLPALLSGYNVTIAHKEIGSNSQRALAEDIPLEWLEAGLEALHFGR